MEVTPDLLRRLPKAELHVHLDGCLRPTTMLELAEEAGVTLPATDASALARHMFVKDVRSLEEYLARYEVTLSVMQTPEALERVAYEFVMDVAADNTRYVEVRYCPALHAPAMSSSEAIDAPLRGLARGRAESGTEARLIVCGLRTLDPTVSRAMAEIAAEYAGDGVVAFDLAGAERGHPARDHADAFAIAAEAGLHITCHAGEGAGPESILDALEHCRPQRIGHGVRVREDPALMARLRDEGIPLEMCPTSNVHTRAVRDVHDHPLRAYFDGVLTVTINTDSRLMDDITLTDELWLAHEHLGFGREQLDQLILNAFESAFLPPAEKDPMVAAAKRELKAIS